jgi:hypothetical protein
MVSVVNDFTNGAMKFDVASVIALCERNFVKLIYVEKVFGRLAHSGKKCMP